MEELAKKCIEDHKNSLVKFNLPATKLFLKSDDLKYTEEHLDGFKKVLGHLRVEKRYARSQAVWVKELSLGKVTKVARNLLNSFGFQDKSGIFLYPEEVLFLMETNRLEIKIDENCLSIQDMYNMVINLTGYNSNKYLVYKKLVLQGYKVINLIEHKRKLKKQCNKRKSESNLNDGKKIKIDELEEELKVLQSKEEIIIKKIDDIFKRIQENAPTSFRNVETDLEVEYFAFSTKNNSNNYEFRIIQRNNIDFTEDIKCSEKDIFAICSDENVAFYKLSKVIVPDLS
ncbi:unnamed protein product [Brassicogethes aeneus]|uniref:tRNA-splicing endonuclease subunit Sen54 N-terminal domain-containing protein n=1 Tax=Brassicogethes aeneus TaxID=1431903 RepID=A0A9P0BG27_BRAAE|nr:unnamed protein product [Brassicogethes aeneus]